MSVVDTGNGYRVGCDNCQRELSEDEPVVVWHHRSWGDVAPSYTQTRGCVECADSALNEELGGRPFSLRRALGYNAGKGPHIRQTQCHQCERGVLFVTLTKYSGRYTRVAYCSDHCRDANKKRVRPPKICKACSVRFIPTRADAKTCSAACKQKLYRQRRKLGIA